MKKIFCFTFDLEYFLQPPTPTVVPPTTPSPTLGVLAHSRARLRQTALTDWGVPAKRQKPSSSLLQAGLAGRSKCEQAGPAAQVKPTIIAKPRKSKLSSQIIKQNKIIDIDKFFGKFDSPWFYNQKSCSYCLQRAQVFNDQNVCITTLQSKSTPRHCHNNKHLLTWLTCTLKSLKLWLWYLIVIEVMGGDMYVRSQKS